MGMRIGNSSPSASTQSVGSGQWQQRQQGVKDLLAALQGGDLSAAQKAFAAITGSSAGASTSSNTASTSTSSTSSGAGSNGNGPLAQIGHALANGDLAAAQQAAQSWQASRSSASGGHHHHHHGGQSPAPAAATSTASSSTGTGSIINLQA